MCQSAPRQPVLLKLDITYKHEKCYKQTKQKLYFSIEYIFLIWCDTTQFATSRKQPYDFAFCAGKQRARSFEIGWQH